MSIAPESNICPACGRHIPAEAPHGLCPNCLLMRVSLPTEGGKGQSGKTTPPTLEELAAAFPQLEILELIGQGGMGFVFKARQPKIDRLVALKILPQSMAADPAFAERFTREGRVLARLNHPNIVTLHDFGQSGGFFYLLMEYVDGVNLRQAMRAGRFTADQALAVVPKICEALQYAHNEGILHRDIKPENILLDAKGRVKIADFGIAKLMAETTGSLPLSRSPDDVPPGKGQGDNEAPSLTETGKILGTRQYMAPEQLEKPGSVDHRADIFSLGVVFYEMLTGELPLGKFAPPSGAGTADARLDEVVLRALAKEPERRYQQASEFKAHVDTIAGKMESPQSEPPTTTRPMAALTNPFSQGRKSAMIAILAIALVVTMALVWFFRNYTLDGAAPEAIEVTFTPVGIRDHTPPGAASEKELASRFELALKARDTNAIIALFNWQGVSKNMKSFGSSWQESLIKCPTDDIHVVVRLLPLPTDYETEMVRDGIRYAPNVTLMGVLSGSVGWLDQGTNRSFGVLLPYGKNSRRFYLAGTVGTRVYDPKTKDKELLVNLATSNHHNGLTFTGAVTYVQNGREIKKDFNTRVHNYFWGDYVKSCVVQKTSDDKGLIQLTIREDGKKVFESQSVATKEPIVYERNGTNSQAPIPESGPGPVGASGDPQSNAASGDAEGKAGK